MTQHLTPLVTGLAAHGGSAEGCVRVVRGASDQNAFREGDILVAGTTEPSMVIMMNKAAAIVTDKGGMTCHAAIIARELGIPCIVATKTGTTILKNGMRVIVDGTRGEVRAAV